MYIVPVADELHLFTFNLQVKKRGKRKVIGVLDIYGFEIFQVHMYIRNLE